MLFDDVATAIESDFDEASTKEKKDFLQKKKKNHESTLYFWHSNCFCNCIGKMYSLVRIWIRIERTENTASNTKLAHRKHQIGKVVFAHPKLIDT